MPPSKTPEQRAMWAATLAARKILAQAKNRRTLLSTYPPTTVAYHAAYAAIVAYRNASKSPPAALPASPPLLSIDARGDLIDYLYWQVQTARYSSRWAMSGDWLDECARLLATPPADPEWFPVGRPPQQPLPPMILGLPVEAREGAGAPHLEG